MVLPVPAEISAWLRTHTLPPSDAPYGVSRAATVSVCLPALDEAPTIRAICEVLVGLQHRGLIDQVVVVDSGSSDGTADLARAAGVEVHHAEDLWAASEPVRGKGDVLWRSLSVLTGDIVVWLDSDTRNFGPHFVLDLVGPLLARPELVMVKAFYERPLRDGDALRSGGARVTELLARPAIAAFAPELAGFVQPLSGEYALRRRVAMDLPFCTGYAVDLALLLDVVAACGLDAVAQADLGVRVHRNRDIASLGRTAHEVLAGLLLRLEAHGRLKTAGEPSDLLQFDRSGGTPVPEVHRAAVVERAPAASVFGAL